MEELPQKQFTLRWEIDWTAHTKEEAARQVLKMLQDPDHTATMFEVWLEEESGEEDGSLVDPNDLMTAYIDNDFDDVFVTCPHCGQCEQHPIDEQRHHLQVYNILSWEEDSEEGDEVSRISCDTCHREFTLVWRYKVGEEVELDPDHRAELVDGEVCVPYEALEKALGNPPTEEEYEEFKKFAVENGVEEANNKLKRIRMERQ